MFGVSSYSACWKGSSALANSQARERSKFIIKAPTYRKENGAFIICESHNYPARHNYFEEHAESVHRGIDYRTHHTGAMVRFEVID